MSTMYGADVAQLRGLARQFDSAASRLDGDRMAVGNAIQISAWVGPGAVRFRAQWESDHSRRLHNAAEILRQAAFALRSNADDQERTSAIDGSGGAVRPSSARPSPELWQEWVARFGSHGYLTVPGLFSFLEGLLAARPAEGFPLLGSFDMAFALSKIPHVGSVTSAISALDLLFDGEASGWDKVWGSAGYGVDAASGALKSLPWPGYLFGVATAQVWDVFDAARQADFSIEQIGRNASFIGSNPAEAASAAAGAVVDYIPDLIDNIWPW